METAVLQMEERIKSGLLNKPLTHLEFYNINDKYWVFDEERVWVLDCGIELTAGTELFSFGWNAEKQLYEHHSGKLEELKGELEPKALHAMEVEGIKELIGQKITDVTIQWNFYHDLDENYEPTEQKNYMPMEMVLTFENGSTLQLAAIKFRVDTENKSIGNVTFDSTGDFLVALNHPFEIKEEDDESMIDEELI
jgi:hypothetical protein